MKAQVKSKDTATPKQSRPAFVSADYLYNNAVSEQSRSIRHIVSPQIQKKVAIGNPGDKYEREADAVAENIVTGKTVSTISSVSSLNGSSSRTQRQQSDDSLDESVQTKLIQREVKEDDYEKEDGSVQAKLIQFKSVNETDEEEEKDKVQAKRANSQSESSSKPSTSQLASHAINNKGAGTPVQSDVRNTLEQGLQQDLSHVRVHETNSDRESASSIGARAFTYQNHIWLGKGESQTDVRLMAHETTHVLQQGGIVRRKPDEISDVSPRVQRQLINDSFAGEQITENAELSNSAAIENKTADAATEEPGWIKRKILNQVAKFANEIPGFHLLSVVIGRNPVTGKSVERNASSVIHAVLGLLPGGNLLFENLQKAGVIERAYAWFSNQLTQLNLTWETIKSLFKQAMDSISLSGIGLFNLSDIISREFNKIKQVFLEPVRWIKNFAVAAGKKVLQFTFEGALNLAGSAGKKVMQVINKGKETFWLIINNPVAFLSNLLKAVGQGFEQFSSNIWKHLKAGFMKWLFRTLSNADLEMPEKFNLKGIVSIVLQVLGLTYEKIRVKLVEKIGVKNVKRLETGMAFLKTLVTEGLAGAWQMIVEQLGSLRTMVIGAIKNWVVTEIITSAITKLATMFNPIGAIIQAVKIIYKTVMFFIERAKQIMALANSVFESVINIANGNVKSAADYIEQTMAKTIPLIISFLARQLGLGGLSAHIMNVIKKIQAKVSLAVDKVIGFIVDKSRSLMGKGKAAARSTVGKLVKWWKKRRKFSVRGEEHELYFTGDDNNAEIMMSSVPQRVETFLNENPPKGNDAKLAKLYGDAHKLHGQLKRDTSKKPKRAGDDQASSPDLTAMDVLATRLKEYMEMLQSGSRHAETKIAFKNLHNGMGKFAIARPLTIPGKEGSKPSVSNRIWDIVRQRYDGGRTHYVRGHLISQQLHGPGNTNKNLTPITQEANAQHEREVESPVKDKVWNRDAENPFGVAVEYRVEAIYGNHKVGLPGMLKKLDRQGGDAETRNKIRSILTAEQNLPTELICDAQELERVLDQKYKDQKYKKTDKYFIRNKKIPNNISDTLPVIGQVKPREKVNLSTDGISIIEKTPYLSEAMATRIVKARPDDGYSRYAELKNRADMPATVIEKLRNDSFVIIMK